MKLKNPVSPLVFEGEHLKLTLTVQAGVWTVLLEATQGNTSFSLATDEQSKIKFFLEKDRSAGLLQEKIVGLTSELKQIDGILGKLSAQLAE